MAASTHNLSSPSTVSANSNSGRTPPNPENNNGDTFPVGLRVLVVDDDPICLLILDRMLRRCQYQVTTCGKATEALAMLRENKNNFDVILSDVYMPDMDGFKLLELVGLEMDLPVIMMSANGETSAVMKGIKHGACDYLLKPVRMEELRNIWQHVLRKKWRSSGQTASNDDDKNRQAPDDNEYNSSANEDGAWKPSKKRKDVKEEEDDPDIDNDDPSTTKKPRVVWSVELHQQFVNAVNQLGIDKAVPKRILELMNVQGLTRENVASHLQKYRLYLKRISGVAHPQGGLNPSFSASGEANYGAVGGSGMPGLGELRSLGATNNMSPQALVSTLQAGLLGRLGNNLGLGNVDPSILLQIAALQSANNGGLNRSTQVPSYSQPLISNQGTISQPLINNQPFQSDLSQLQVSQLGAYAGSIDKGPSGLSPLQQHQLGHQSNYTGLGQINNNLQPVNSNSNALGQLQVVGNSISQVNTVSSPLAQLGSVNNNLQQVNSNSNSLGQLSGVSGNIQQVNPSLGPISNVGNNHQHVNTNNNPLLLQALQQQQAAKSGLNMPSSGIVGQHGISTDSAIAWGPNISATGSGLTGQNSGPLRQMSMSATVGANSVVNVLGAPGRTTDAESQPIQLPSIGSTALQNTISVSSPLGASGLDDLSAGRMKDIGSSLPISNDVLAQNSGSKFPLHGGHKQGQGHQSIQRNQSNWQGFGLGQEYGQINSAPMRSASFNQLPNNGQGYSNYGVGQDHSHISSPNFSTGLSNNYRSLSDSSMKIKEEGHDWLPDPLSDDLLNIVFKQQQQQQEALGLTESQPGGADSYVMDNMYVK